MATLLTSVRGRRLGLSPAGRPVADPQVTGSPGALPVVYTATAASTALSNFTSARAADNYITIPANMLEAGSRIKIKYQGIQTAVNGTDTIAVGLNIGGTLAASTLAVTGGTALLAGTATAGVSSGVVWGEYNLIVRTAGSSGTMVGWGLHKPVIAAEATVTVKDDILASTTIDTTVAQIVCVPVTYGAASSSNSFRVDHFEVEVA